MRGQITYSLIRYLVYIFIAILVIVFVARLFSLTNYYGRLSVKMRYLLVSPLSSILGYEYKVSSFVEDHRYQIGATTAGAIYFVGCVLIKKLKDTGLCKPVKKLTEKTKMGIGFLSGKIKDESRIKRVLENIRGVLRKRLEAVSSSIKNRRLKYALYGGVAAGTLAYELKSGYFARVNKILKDIVSGVLSSITPVEDVLYYDNSSGNLVIPKNLCKDLKKHLLPEAYLLIKKKYGDCGSGNKEWEELTIQYLIARNAIYTFSESLYGNGGSGSGQMVCHYVSIIINSEYYNKNVYEKDILCWWAAMQSKKEEGRSILEEIYGDINDPVSKEYIQKDGGGTLCNILGVDIKNVVTDDESEGINILVLSGRSFSISNGGVSKKEDYDGFIYIGGNLSEIDFYNTGMGNVWISTAVYI